ncbi:MAG: hypothetical protein M0018_08910 [Nitrospiraceae bacterium]|nr:hypothetical protein [Nitrospiraceae bacterium]
MMWEGKQAKARKFFQKSIDSLKSHQADYVEYEAAKVMLKKTGGK